MALELHDGETIVTSYPSWTEDQARYIISVINLGYEPSDVDKFIDEMHRHDIDRVDDLHNFINRKAES